MISASTALPKRFLTPFRSCTKIPKRLACTKAENKVQNVKAPLKTLQAPRGMQDVFGLEQIKRQFIVDTCKRVANVYGFEEIATPIAEDESVFSRTLGNDSDVVSKEMYTFPDRSDNMLSLRPEGTAGVVRAAINHKHLLSSRLYYCGPMFRYERPQKGRSRQVGHLSRMIGLSIRFHWLTKSIILKNFIYSSSASFINLALNI